MPDQLTDCKITKVYAGPVGKSEHGPWQMWNFYTDKTDKKFTWFAGEKKITPVEGMQIAYMEYEEETKGKYTNLNVKKLVLKEDSTPEAIPNAKEDGYTVSPPSPKNDREVSFYVSYMKDVAVAIINGNGALTLADLDEMGRKIAKAGIVMMNESLNNGEIPPQVNKTVAPLQDNEKPVPSGYPKGRRSHLEGNLKEIPQNK